MDARGKLALGAVARALRASAGVLLLLASSHCGAEGPTDATGLPSDWVGDAGSTSDHDGAVACLKAAEGCPCAEAGASVECGWIVRNSGNYKSCSMGHIICTNGAWSACQGDRLAK